MATLSGVPLCSRAVDLLIYGISTAVSLQAAVQLRDPDRLITALPPQRLKSSGADGPITEGQSTPLDGSKPPKQILDIVRETTESYGLPEAKVSIADPTCFQPVLALYCVLALYWQVRYRRSARSLACLLDRMFGSNIGQNSFSRWYWLQISWIGCHS